MTMRRSVPSPVGAFPQQTAPNFGTAAVGQRLPSQGAPALQGVSPPHQSLQAPSRGPPPSVPNAKPGSMSLSAAVQPQQREQASPPAHTAKFGAPSAGSHMPLGGQAPIMVGRSASPSGIRRAPSKEATEDPRRPADAPAQASPARLTTPGAAAGNNLASIAATGPAAGPSRPAPPAAETGSGGYLLPARPAPKATQTPERSSTPVRADAAQNLDRARTPQAREAAATGSGFESDRSGRGGLGLSNQMSENILSSRPSQGSDDYALKPNASASAFMQNSMQQSPAKSNQSNDLDTCTRNVPVPGGQNSEAQATRIREVEQLNAELERRLDEDGKAFLEALASLEAEVEALTKQNKLLVEQQNKMEERLSSQGSDGELRAQNLRMEQERQDMLQQLDEFEQEKEQDILQLREEMDSLRQKLSEQERKYSQRIVELERERDNHIQSMVDEGQELSSRIEKLNRDKETLSLDLAKALARADVAASASADPPRGGVGMSLNNQNLTEASSQLRSVIQERETLKDEVTQKDGELLILKNQVKIAEKKLKLTDMENTRLKSELEACQKSLDKNTASPVQAVHSASPPPIQQGSGFSVLQQPAAALMASKEAAIPTTRSPRVSATGSSPRAVASPAIASPTVFRAPVVNGLR